VYVLCVIGELALVAAGSRRLETTDNLELRPALIALTVGLHFLPFAWAFKERIFYMVGGTLTLVGGLGLLIGTQTSALAAATGSGLIMSLILLTYSIGLFTSRLLQAVGRRQAVIGSMGRPIAEVRSGLDHLVVLAARAGSAGRRRRPIRW
jgi:hypothetical protein